MTYSILITTKNRLEELKYTLLKCNDLLMRNDVETIICDDGSSDGTSEYIEANFPSILLLKNKESKGLIYSRNRLLEMTTAKYAISLDDDSHFLSRNPLEIIKKYFESHPKCGVQAFRIFWGTEGPEDIKTLQKPQRVKGFVGCGHAWRMKTWKDIPNYPDWFVFYGEEEFASFQLYLKKWEIHYVPEILVKHRVIVAERKKHKDYKKRLRQSLRAGWYLYFLFYPKEVIPRKMVYTIYIQIKQKVLKGDFRALISITSALLDVFINLPRLLMNRNSLSRIEFDYYSSLPDTFIYWDNKNE